MERNELKELILDWAKQKKGPFVTAEAFKNIEEAESTEQISNCLRELFMTGELARKKIDNVRYAYVIPSFATNDFVFSGGNEKAGEDAFQVSEGGKVAAREVNPSKRIEEIKEEVFKTGEERGKSTMQKDDTDIQKPLPNKTNNDHKMIPGARENTVFEGIPLEGVAQLPEAFTLTLQTPGGLVITISSGSGNGSAS